MKSICVYCGSSPGRDPEHRQSARQLAQAMHARGIGLVYGGAGVGVMGEIADQMLALGGEVIGVIPQGLFGREVAHDGLSELKVVSSMHERKAMMAELSDGFIALPGGLGTLEELFEALTWAQLGIHHKPCGLLNTSGYYDALCRFLDQACEQQFVRPQHREMLLTASEPEALLDTMADYVSPVQQQWLSRHET